MSWFRLYSILAFFIVSQSAVSQEHEESRPKIDENSWSIYGGAGSFISPTYSGDDDYIALAAPFVRVTKGERFFASVQEGLVYTAFRKDGFKAGPVLSFDMGRQQDGSPLRIGGKASVDLIGFGDIKRTLAIGGFADYKLGQVTIKSKLAKALGSHQGLSGELSVEYGNFIMSFGPPLIISFGPKVKIADSQYLQAFYGVSSEQSAATGLDAYQANSGLFSYGVGGSVLMALSKTSSVLFFASYDRLTGAASDSPLVRERGRADQFFAGALAIYKFK